MKLTETSEELESYLASPTKFQQTFQTPLKDLPRFVATILSPFRLEQATLTIEQVVFGPEHLLQLLASQSISPNSVPAKYFMHVTISADGPEEVAALLQAALGDWVDFIFVPTPESFTIYTDHDEYATFFVNKDSDLALLGSALAANGFKAVHDYVRLF